MVDMFTAPQTPVQPTQYLNSDCTLSAAPLRVNSVILSSLQAQSVQASLLQQPLHLATGAQPTTQKLESQRTATDSSSRPPQSQTRGLLMQSPGCLLAQPLAQLQSLERRARR